MLVRTRVASNKSPWLSECDVNDEHLIAISHGEGRFVCSDSLLDQLIANGQIATQYVDLTCTPTMDLRYNPNGSVLAIEGITSPDGRVLGKMGHSERSGDELYKNVGGDKYQPLFEGGCELLSSCNSRCVPAFREGRSPSRLPCKGSWPQSGLRGALPPCGGSIPSPANRQAASRQDTGPAKCRTPPAVPGGTATSPCRGGFWGSGTPGGFPKKGKASASIRSVSPPPEMLLYAPFLTKKKEVNLCRTTVIFPPSPPGTPRTRCSFCSRTTKSSAPGAGCGSHWPGPSSARAWTSPTSRIAELEAHKDDVNYEEAAAREKLVRHDVMSHVYAYGLQCPHAKGIIHLGATSCYVGDNTDVIIMRDALQLVRKKLIGVLANLAVFAKEYKDMPCLAYTHCQPAQLTTVGKRATLWMNELYMDVCEIDHQISSLALRGVKGTTGTQASFMELFGGDSAKVKAVEADVCAQMGFDKVVPVCGQTYSRKVDYNVLSVLGGLAQSAMKMATDIRLLANFKEMEEPFEKNQIGSSAMPYKRNPMRCERICALARYLMIDVLNPAMTAGTQWFERTLDDSANKRIAMAEGFLAADAILNILLNVSDGLVVYPKVVRSRVMAELPFMASENIMMKAVKKGGDRQELHERLREHAVAAAAVVKQEGKPNDMIARVEADPAFGLTREEIEAELSPEAFTGRAPEQVEEYLRDVIQPLLDANPEDVGQKAELSV